MSENIESIRKILNERSAEFNIDKWFEWRSIRYLLEQHDSLRDLLEEVREELRLSKITANSEIKIIRNEFASRAMQGMMASPLLKNDISDSFIAERAYELADALLKHSEA